MKKIIHHLRRQPEHIRRHILHATTLVVGIILIFFWMFSLGNNLSNPDTKIKISNDLKPLNALKDNLIGGYKSITESQ